MVALRVNLKFYRLLNEIKYLFLGLAIINHLIHSPLPTHPVPPQVAHLTLLLDQGVLELVDLAPTVSDASPFIGAVVEPTLLRERKGKDVRNACWDLVLSIQF